MANKKPEVIFNPESVRSVVTKYIIHFNIDQTLLLPESSGLPKEEQVINHKNINI